MRTAGLYGEMTCDVISTPNYAPYAGVSPDALGSLSLFAIVVLLPGSGCVRQFDGVDEEPLLCRVLLSKLCAALTNVRNWLV
jgi:hypothetical protein